MIIDGHAHIFPFLGGGNGFPSVQDHLRVLQLYMVGHSQPVRRLRDHNIVTEETLADLPLDRPERLRDVGFHVGEHGRFLWRHQGEELYIHFMPPSLQTNAFPAEALLAQMAYVGVDAAVLQNAHLYGRLNEYFAAAMARYPGRFIGLAEVDEPNADSDAELRSLQAAVHTLGLKGLYYANRGFLFDNYRHSFDHPRYEVLWETVRALGIPVFWELFGVPVHDDASYLRELDRLVRWATRYRDIVPVLVHGISPHFLAGNLEEPIARLLRTEQIWIEVLYPIRWGHTHEYPYTELQPAIRELYHRAGAHRLVWGSDMPNVERNCTYRQSLDYLRRHCTCIPPADMQRIVGENLRELFKLP
jgi:predicted TIM-barrel fold metal-dependent hydrolase